jgi:ribonuclease R
LARRTPPRPAQPPPAARGLPSREELLAFITEHGGKVGKREIARAFHISGGDRIELKRLLQELEAEGTVDRKGRRLGRAGHLPSVVLADVTGRELAIAADDSAGAEDGDLIAADVVKQGR